MKIIYEKTKYFEFAFDFPYNTFTIDFCRSLKEAYGWQNFTYSDNRWRFKDPGIIFLIKEKFPAVFVEPAVTVRVQEMERQLQEELKQEERALEIKEKLESDIEIPGMKSDLRGYQKLGVEFFINNNGRCILADEMGSGKTVQSLAYVLKTGFKKTLVVCPASVKYSWDGEIKKWTHLNSFLTDSHTDFTDIGIDVDIVIINYDILKKHLKELMAVSWDCVIADEGHLLKNKDAQRSKCVKLISQKVSHVILLTGTPLLSRPVELFNLLNILDPQNWNNYYSFANRYCGGHMGQYGYEAKGATNLDELRQKISRYFLRRTKDQILKELPPKNKIPVEIELTGEWKKAYDKVSKEFVKYLRENKKKKDKEIMKSLAGEKLVKLNYLREINAMGKVQSAKELIDTIIDSGEKVLVFSSFNEPLKTLYEEYDNSVMILGETDVMERGDIVNKFQTNPECNVFFGGIKSAGVGITLTAASNVIFLDHSWNPADMLQAEDRVHRLGQEAESVNIYQIVSRGTIDDFMIKLLARKQVIFDVVIDSAKVERGQEDTMEELIKMIEEQNNE